MSLNSWDCPCGTRNAPQFTACRNCRKPQAGRLAASEREMLRPSGPMLRRMTDEEIRAEMTAILKAEGSKDGHATMGGAGCIVIGSFVALLIPGIGPLVFIVWLLGGLAYAGKALLGIISPQIDPVRLKQMCHQAAGRLTGNCPACQGEMRVPAQGDEFTFQCPNCGDFLRSSRLALSVEKRY